MPLDQNEKFLKTQMILAVIPIPIPVTQLFAFYRMHKLVYGIIIEVIVSTIDLVILGFWWPYGMTVTLPLSVLIPLYYIRKWTVDFNKNKSLF